MAFLICPWLISDPKSLSFCSGSVQLLSSVRLFVTPWTAARQASCPSPTPGVYPTSCPSSQWCHPTISSSVIPSPAFNLSQHQSFPMSQFFASCDQSVAVSASTSVLPMNTQDWSPLGWTCKVIKSLFPLKMKTPELLCQDPPQG